jgi:hypothetical protein
MKRKLFLSFIAISSLFLFGLRKPEKETVENLVPLYIQFVNQAGGQPLQLNTGEYSNEAGELFTVSMLQYFISNIRLRNTNGKDFVVPNDSSYFLINESSPDSRLVRVNVPEGEYDRIYFIVGVDSLRNTMPVGKRNGVLDPANSMDNGMYWGWNSGYIFFKMEGNSPKAPVDPTGQRKFRYHIGGFGGYSALTINNIKQITIDLPGQERIIAHKERPSTTYVGADILKTFEGKTSIQISEHPSVMFSAFSVNIANNYSNMFFHHHTENR